jgi:hypothetical protein
MLHEKPKLAKIKEKERRLCVCDDGGHDVHVQSPAPDSNAYTHLYWLVTKDTDEQLP